MNIRIYGILIAMSAIFGVLLYTPYAKYTLLALGIIFQITVIIFGSLALLEGYFLRLKAAYTKQIKCET